MFPALPHRRPARALLAIALTLTTLAPLACGSPVETVNLRADLGATDVELFDGLVQRVTVTPAEPVIGEEVEIRSVVVNRGQRTPQFIENTCRLDLESTLDLAPVPEWAECKALPRETALFPGDSLVMRTRKRVQGVAGEHEIRVLHVMEPQYWVPVRVRMRPSN